MKKDPCRKSEFLINLVTWAGFHSHPSGDFYIIEAQRKLPSKTKWSNAHHQVNQQVWYNNSNVILYSYTLKRPREKERYGKSHFSLASFSSCSSVFTETWFKLEVFNSSSCSSSEFSSPTCPFSCCCCFFFFFFFFFSSLDHFQNQFLKFTKYKKITTTKNCTSSWVAHVTKY